MSPKDPNKNVNTFIRSPEELKGAKVPSYIEKVESLVHPAFGAAMGERMQIVRWKMFIDQTELGEKLACSQQVISRLEQGRYEIAPFTLGALRAVFGVYINFILFGTGAPNSWNVTHLKRQYHDVKHRVRRKPGSGIWKKEAVQKQNEAYWDRVKKSGKSGA
jgi:transcriptional regulator with XRE-family HTH domain